MAAVVQANEPGRTCVVTSRRGKKDDLSVLKDRSDTSDILQDTLSEDDSVSKVKNAKSRTGRCDPPATG